MSEVDAKAPQENPLTNILVNVIVPVLVLSHMSKDPALQEKLGESVRAWHVGPGMAIIIALAFPSSMASGFSLNTRRPTSSP